MKVNDRLDASLLAWVGVGALACLFVSAACVRQLNFDEWLVLRTGWLLQNNVASGLHFMMPYTYMCGYLANHISVNACILALRLAVAIALLSTIFWTFSQVIRNRLATAIALLFCLTNGAFVSHAFEFRYDAVILCCWLLAWGISQSSLHHRAAILGVIVGVLTCHHLKGMFFAGLLSILVMTNLCLRRRELVIFISTAGATLLAWAGYLTMANLLHEQLAFYKQFLSLSSATTGVGILESLGDRLKTDSAWWKLSLACCAVHAWRWRPTRGSFGLYMGVVPIFFIALHPRPWDYMLAPIIPFVAVSAALGFLKFWTTIISRASSIALAIRYRPAITWTLIALSLFPLTTGTQSYTLALETNFRDETALLSQFRQIMRNDDRVLDPTGALYFVAPFDTEWYLDTLFLPQLRSNHWMTATITQGEAATVVVNSYRKNWLPQVLRARLEETHEPACGWLWLRKSDVRLKLLRNVCPQPESRYLVNYWGR